MNNQWIPNELLINTNPDSSKLNLRFDYWLAADSPAAFLAGTPSHTSSFRELVPNLRLSHDFTHMYQTRLNPHSNYSGVIWQGWGGARDTHHHKNKHVLPISHFTGVNCEHAQHNGSVIALGLSGAVRYVPRGRVFGKFRGLIVLSRDWLGYRHCGGMLSSWPRLLLRWRTVRWVSPGMLNVIVSYLPIAHGGSQEADHCVLTVETRWPIKCEWWDLSRGHNRPVLLRCQ
jgi:hypothetical protein